MTPPQKDAINEEKAKENIRACADLGGDCDRNTEHGPCHAFEKGFLVGINEGRKLNFPYNEKKNKIIQELSAALASERANAEKLIMAAMEIVVDLDYVFTNVFAPDYKTFHEDFAGRCKKILTDYKASGNADSKEGGK